MVVRQPTKKPPPAGAAWLLLVLLYGLLCALEWLSSEGRRVIAERLFPRPDPPPSP